LHLKQRVLELAVHSLDHNQPAVALVQLSMAPLLTN